MEKMLHQHCSFSKGTYLHERQPQRTNWDNPPLQIYENWRESGGFTYEALAFRLSSSKLTIDAFKQLLREKDNPLLQQKLDWMGTLQTILNQPGHTLTTEEINNLLGESVFGYFYLPFLDYANSLIIDFNEKFAKDTETPRIDYSSIRLSILSTLVQQLSMLGGRSLIQELHIAKLSNQLEGETPEARYRFFNEQKLTDNIFINEILSTYPVLARLLVEGTKKCIRSHTEALERFIKDAYIIENVFFSKKPLTLKSLQSGVGDLHQEGRSVIIFSFEDEKKLVYKPRSLHIDQHFSDLLTWVNEKDPIFSLKAPQTVARSHYGWQEFIPQTPCSSQKDIKRFYFRQGGYVALLYLLGSKDFHHENIIAAGSHPIIIDLETLFNNHDEMHSGSAIVEEFSQSVLGSLMLPASVSVKGNIDFDLSALGGSGGQKSKTLTSWKLEHPETDDMRLVKAPVFSIESQNRPSIQGNPVNAADYTRNVEAGFRRMYALLLRHRKKLIHPSGPLYRFSKVQVRHVVRPTQTYANFLEASIHPDYLKDGLKREQLFDFLWQIIKSFPKYKRIIHSECQDLLKHDIPYFTFQFNSRDIVNSKGEIIHDFYERSSLELVLERCKKLSLEDCEKQQRYIRMSLSTLLDESWESENKPFPMKTNAYTDQLTFLEVAKKIGNYIAKDVICTDDDENINWLSVTLDGEDKLTFAPLKEDLYSGLSGFALFFGQLAHETEEPKYKSLAQGILNSALNIADNRTESMSLSAFYGFGAITYTTAYLGSLWERDDLIDKALNYLKRIEKKIGKTSKNDFLGGEAGAIIVCLRIHEIIPDSHALNIAIKCGDYLEKMLLSPDNKEQMWAGLSHGASGYAWPMIELGITVNEDRFLNAGFNLLNYERTLYIPEKKNWSDLRKKNTKEPSPAYWCHGAPGIALARLNILKVMENEQANQELATAIETTFNYGFNTSHSLCHGDFGNLDILLSIASYKQDDELTERIMQLSTSVLQQGLNLGWRHGLHPKAEVHGFMLGASGIGYALLRLWNHNVPSVLNLELPCNSKRTDNV